MSNGTTGWVTVLFRLPVLYNEDARGHREPIEDEKFEETAGALPAESHLSEICRAGRTAGRERRGGR